MFSGSYSKSQNIMVHLNSSYLQLQWNIKHFVSGNMLILRLLIFFLVKYDCRHTDIFNYMNFQIFDSKHSYVNETSLDQILSKFILETGSQSVVLRVGPTGMQRCKNSFWMISMKKFTMNVIMSWLRVNIAWCSMQCHTILMIYIIHENLWKFAHLRSIACCPHDAVQGLYEYLKPLQIALHYKPIIINYIKNPENH